MILAKSNKSLRTFTLRVYFKGKLISKYRTYPLTRDEFESACNYTYADWRAFLNSDHYYVLNND